MDQAPVQNVDVAKSLETTLLILNHKLKRGVIVQRHYHADPLWGDSFGSELNQVWTNLIDNAIDAMGGNGELRVRTYRDNGCAVVEIGDNGPGMSPEIKSHIFEPFSQPREWVKERGSVSTRPAHCEEAPGQYSGRLKTWRHALSSVAPARGSSGVGAVRSFGG